MPLRAGVGIVNEAHPTGLFDRLVSAAVPLVPGPIVRRLGAPYVAGTTLADALGTVARLRADGLEVTLDLLGEHVADRAAAAAAADAYIEVLDALQARGLESHLSVKLSGLGYALGLDVAAEGATRILGRAEELGTFVRLDMEDSSMTDDTLALYGRLRAAGHERVGIVLQARLWRTAADVEALAALTPSVRLCKGIYLEPPRGRPAGPGGDPAPLRLPAPAAAARRQPRRRRDARRGPCDRRARRCRRGRRRPGAVRVPDPARRAPRPRPTACRETTASVSTCPSASTRSPTRNAGCARTRRSPGTWPAT